VLRDGLDGAVVAVGLLAQNHVRLELLADRGGLVGSGPGLLEGHDLTLLGADDLLQGVVRLHLEARGVQQLLRVHVIEAGFAVPLEGDVAFKQLEVGFLVDLLELVFVVAFAVPYQEAAVGAGTHQVAALFGVHPLHALGRVVMRILDRRDQGVGHERTHGHGGLALVLSQVPQRNLAVLQSTQQLIRDFVVEAQTHDGRRTLEHDFGRVRVLQRPDLPLGGKGDVGRLELECGVGGGQTFVVAHEVECRDCSLVGVLE